MGRLIEGALLVRVVADPVRNEHVLAEEIDQSLGFHRRSRINPALESETFPTMLR